MELIHFTYLGALAVVLIVLATIAFRGGMFSLQKMKYYVPAILVPGALFAFFGVRMTQLGIKTFNTDYLCGTSLFGLPIEEYLYLIIVPFLIFLVYEWIKQKKLHASYYNYYIILGLVLLTILIVATYLGRKDFYTLMVFLFSTTFFGYVFFRNLLKDKYPSFFIAFAIVFAAWFLFEWPITWLGVVIFNSNYMSGIRLLSVPIEEMGSFFLLMLMNISVYEYLSERKIF